MVSGFELSRNHGDVTYAGEKINDGIGGQIVHRRERTFDGLLTPAASQKLINHSSDGFNWGYFGSGPAQLALGLLLDATHDPSISLRYYQDFKFDFVSNFKAEWKITDTEILAWLAKRKSEVNHGKSR